MYRNSLFSPAAKPTLNSFAFDPTLAVSTERRNAGKASPSRHPSKSPWRGSPRFQRRLAFVRIGRSLRAHQSSGAARPQDLSRATCLGLGKAAPLRPGVEENKGHSEGTHIVILELHEKGTSQCCSYFGGGSDHSSSRAQDSGGTPVLRQRSCAISVKQAKQPHARRIKLRAKINMT